MSDEEILSAQASVESRVTIERLWIEEAVRRYQQLKDGTATSSPSEEVFARLEARVR